MQLELSPPDPPGPVPAPSPPARVSEAERALQEFLALPLDIQDGYREYVRQAWTLAPRDRRMLFACALERYTEYGGLPSAEEREHLFAAADESWRARSQEAA